MVSQNPPPTQFLCLSPLSKEELPGLLQQLPLRSGSGDTLLIGFGGGSAKGTTKPFIMNALRGVGKALDEESLFTEKSWEAVNYGSKNVGGTHYYKSVGANQGQSTESVVDAVLGELLKNEGGHKYSDEDILALVSDSRLRVIQEWKDPCELYRVVLLERPPFHFPLLKEPVISSTTFDPSELLDNPSPALSPYSIPTIKDWQELWSAWDTITLGMIPLSMLHEKPIDLRHKCLFYLGHIPTFLDIHLSRLLEEPHTEPDNYKYIFERGIDPHVDDPTQCHPHSEVPENDEDWPSRDEILDFRDRVRQRLMKLYEDLKTGRRPLDRKTARVLYMTFEHEAFHAETLLYMLIQRAGTGTIPPPKFIRPQFEALSKGWEEQYAAISSHSLGETVTIEPTIVTIGHDDLEADDDAVPFHPAHEFGWDNENPRRTLKTPQFKISWRPVTNAEYYAHWSDPAKNQGGGKVSMPASWTEVDGKIHVRTLYGPIDFNLAKYWPVQATYDDLSIYAKSKGGRIPTIAELAAFTERYETGLTGQANVGFKNWHPIPATTGIKDAGKGHNGGLWEWTSTVFDNHEGFVQSKLYPGYSTDFFDQKHQVVVGGSYATISRQAHRRSLVNFYQHNYSYAWITARIVYDI